MTRQARFLWMKDILEHLGDCHDQWQYAEPSSEKYLAASMRHDLEQLRRLCDHLAEETSDEHEPEAVTV